MSPLKLSNIALVVAILTLVLTILELVIPS